MSAKLLGIGFACDMESPQRKLVLLKLIDACNDDGTKIFPAVKTIARAAQCSERQVQRELAAFVQAGLLTIVDFGGRGPGSTREYRMSMEVLRRIESDGWSAVYKGDTESPSEDKGDRGDQIRVTGATSKGDTACRPTPYDPSIDPSKKHSARVDLNIFRAAWPTTASDRTFEVEALWHMLTPAEQEAAINAIPEYERQLAETKRDVLPSGQRYLAEKLWLGIKAKGPPGAARPDDPATRAELIHQLTMTAEHSTDEQRKAKARAELDRLASSDDPEIAVLLSRRTG